MRALSIRQPWATLIMMGLKKFETRATTTYRRGRVYIHAASTFGRAEREAAIREGLDPDRLPIGAILGSVEITDSYPAEDLRFISEDERRRGDYREGRWAWKLENVQALAAPVPAKGALSFWQVPADVEALARDVEILPVFVYGSLKRGYWNHRYLMGAARFLGEAHISGTMHDLGSYPAVTLTGTDRVYGEVYEVDGPTLERLDRLEGHPRYYQRTRVRMSNGMEAWTYTQTEERVLSCTRIASGIWKGEPRLSA